MEKIKIIVEVNDKEYHFIEVYGSQEQAHEITRQISLLLKQDKQIKN